MSEDAEFLEELCTIDEAYAWIPTGAEHDLEITPSWCELVLEVKRTEEWPINVRVPLRRHDGELIIQVLHDVLHPGLSTIAGEHLWDALDDVVDRIQKRVTKGKDPMRRDVGQALGLATAMAIIESPLEPDVDAIRAVAMERWEIRNGVSSD